MRSVLTLVCVGLCLQAAATSAAPPPNAAALLDAAIDAMGGRAVLEGVRAVRIDSIGHDFALEQSERPEGPHLVSYQQAREIRDHANARLWRKDELRNWSFADWRPSTVVFADGVLAVPRGDRWRALRADQRGAFERDLALAPERLLLTARAAGDLKSAPERVLHGIPNDAVAFTFAGVPYTLYLNRDTHLPTMLMSVADDRLGIWGDVVTERWYGFWSLQPGGWFYPQQVSTTWNGIPSGDRTVLKIDVNPEVDEALFAIPEDTRVAFRATESAPPASLQTVTLDVSRAIRMTPDIVVLPGAWAVTLVRQADGIVVLEAPIGSAYSAQVIAAASTIFPSMGIKAVVTTSDAWPHLGGVREYVARGIPVFALDLNVPILERLVAARYTTMPDRLARHPRAATWIEVSETTTIGEGQTRIDLIPVRGGGSERMMVAHLPGVNLLYASDLLQNARDGSGFFHPAYAAELAVAMKREGIQGIAQAWAMHMDPIPWSTVTEALAALGR